MNLTVNVTKQDIKAGIRCNIGRCPIARAVRRASRRRDVAVSGRDVEIRRQAFRLPVLARNFVLNFDNGDRVAPITFTLKGYMLEVENA